MDGLMFLWHYRWLVLLAFIFLWMGIELWKAPESFDREDDREE